MGQYEVDFNIESFGNDENDIQYLKTAIDNLTNESEKQFQTIKNEKWFTRIIDLATLSNKKDIRMSQQISNIAQAQDILIELLKRLSATDVKIDNMLLNSMNQIEQLYNHTEKLALKVVDLKEQMIYGINQSKNINDLKDIEKTVLYNLLQEASKTFENTTVEQQQFADSLFRYLQLEHSTVNLSESINQLDSIAIKKVLLQLLLEYGFLNSNNFNFNSGFQEIVEMFDFGNRTINELKDTIQNIYQLRGVEGFSWFRQDTLEHDFFIDLELEEYFEQESEEFNEREQLTLEHIIVIDQDENKVIKNKIINLSSIITVKGKLQFENCEININDNFIPITLQSGILEFINCHVDAKSNKESLIESNENCKIIIDNSSIKTTAAICNDKSNLVISNCNIESNAKTLISCNNLNIINSQIKGLLHNERYPNYLIRIDTGDGIVNVENSNLINIEFQTLNSFNIENCIFDHYINFNSIGSGQISNTKFRNVQGNMGVCYIKLSNCEINSNETNECSLDIYKSTIEDTKIENINDIKLYETTLKNSTIYNVLKVIIRSSNRFESIIFDKCNSIKLYNGNNKFYNSTFSNKTNNKKYQSESFIEYLVGKKDELNTIIEGCLFKNIDVNQGYVVELFCNEKIKENRVKIENCIFESCKSENQRLVKLDSHYYPKFSNKPKQVKLGQEKNNIGIVNI
ncbi:hypothetical protein [Mammaliicoccus sciuri]|uniref:hypothetical protein n=1 Tax=Mammaliicoccus sciuri TaxID=1296 RepID=UPI002DB906D9|nr:hypothetical protein [Mammaliicoccus sciuri]MEB6341609.1 hypothetical protein [Mammaliicoccus sciuri]